MPSLFEDSWTRAWNGCGAEGDGGDSRRALLERYAEPHRHYHTLQHLRECLETHALVNELATHPHEVELALWFHDALYDTRRTDNEARSAEWAANALLAARAPADVADRVRSLVLATRHEAVPADHDQQVLVDIDLSILGAPDARFAEYERQIRAEYAHVPGFLFRSTRRALLKGFLARPRLFGTAHFQQVLEQRARHNLERAIARRKKSS